MEWQSLDDLIVDRSSLTQQDIAALPRGKIKITIRASGDWLFAGTPIQRKEMVALFARQLILVDDTYYLIAPEQLLQIRVQDKPFTILQADIERADNGSQVIRLMSNSGHQLVLGGEHCMELHALPGNDNDQADAFPCVRVENNLFARVSRNVFYQLVDHAEQGMQQGRPAMFVRSLGESHLLGYL